MKPLKFSTGEFFRDDLVPRSRFTFDNLYKEPKKSYAYRVSAKLAKQENSETIPFGNGLLLKSIGNFVININKALDRNNQIAAHIPDPAGRTVFIYGDNPLTVHHVRESVEAILDAYSENHQNEDFDLRKIAGPTLNRSRKFFDCLTAFTSASYVEPSRRHVSVNLPSANNVIERYLGGFDIDKLTAPVSDIAYDSFDLDYGHQDKRQHVFEISEDNNSRTNNPRYNDEKQDSQESLKSFAKHWDINMFEGGKAEYFRRFKSFIQNNLSVTVTISDYSSARIELRGDKQNVLIAKRMGIRAVDLLNEGRPLDDKDGIPGKPLDNEWLENALSDARRYFAIKSLNEKLGVIASPLKTISKKADPKNYPDFHFSGFKPA